jgi:hypothetical protein
MCAASEKLSAGGKTRSSCSTDSMFVVEEDINSGSRSPPEKAATLGFARAAEIKIALLASVLCITKSLDATM